MFAKKASSSKKLFLFCSLIVRDKCGRIDLTEINLLPENWHLTDSDFM